MSQNSTTPTKSGTIKHTLNKERMIEEMSKRGWQFSDAYGWTAPMGQTKRQMEQQWVDSICASVECSDGTEDASA